MKRLRKVNLPKRAVQLNYLTWTRGYHSVTLRTCNGRFAQRGSWGLNVIAQRLITTAAFCSPKKLDRTKISRYWEERDEHFHDYSWFVSPPPLFHAHFRGLSLLFGKCHRIRNAVFNMFLWFSIFDTRATNSKLGRTNLLRRTRGFYIGLYA